MMAQMTEPFEKEAPATSPADQAVPLEEEALLARAIERLAEGAGGVGHETKRYDAELVALRDEIGEAASRMSPRSSRRWSGCKASRRAAPMRRPCVDPRSPYFGHLRLREHRRARRGPSAT